MLKGLCLVFLALVGVAAISCRLHIVEDELKAQGDERFVEKFNYSCGGFDVELTLKKATFLGGPPEGAANFRPEIQIASKTISSQNYVGVPVSRTVSFSESGPASTIEYQLLVLVPTNSGHFVTGYVLRRTIDDRLFEKAVSLNVIVKDKPLTDRPLRCEAVQPVTGGGIE